MEKRMKKSSPLRSFLLRYLLCTALACAIACLVWGMILLGIISSGLVLPAYSGSDATLQAMEKLPAMSADHFDPDALPALCRWVLLDGSVSPGESALPHHVLATNLSEKDLAQALVLGSPVLYQKFYRDVPLIDGTLCRLQYDFTTPYADPALRGILPDFQISMLVILALLLLLIILAMTRRAAAQLQAKTELLTRACRTLAARDLTAPMPGPTHIKEFDSTLQTMDALREELTASLKAQWALEQQRTERMAALTHDLKTPLTIIHGHAELLAEEGLSATEQPSVEAILRAAQRADQYLTALREINHAQISPSAMETIDLADFAAALCATGQALCAPRGLQFISAVPPVGIKFRGRKQDLTRAVENLLINAARFTPQGRKIFFQSYSDASGITLSVRNEGSAFPAAILQSGGQMLSTGDAARSDGHQGLGLYFARTVAESHGGHLHLSNAENGACAALWIPLVDS